MSRSWGGGVSRTYSVRVGGGALSFSEAMKTCFQKYAEFGAGPRDLSSGGSRSSTTS